MKTIAMLLTLVVGTTVVWAQGPGDLVRQASQLTGAEYLQRRQQIVALGEAVVPSLQGILAETNRPWQERAMAGICLDRIQKGPVIQAMLEKNWREDPRLAGHPGWRNRSREPQQLGELISQELRAADVSWFCLELVWKRTGERNPTSRWGWEDMAAAAAFDARNPLIAEVFAERLKEDLDISKVRQDGFYMYLCALHRHQDLPLVVEAWVRAQNRVAADYPSYRASVEKQHARLGLTGTVPLPGGGLDRVLALAKPEDAKWIAEKFSAVPLAEEDRGILNAFLARADTTPPVLTLLGANPVTLECGSPYADAGATATDNKDGDITARIQVENNVDTPKAGTYQVIYRVRDAAGNTATASRTVKVVYKFAGFLAPVGGADAAGGNFEKPVRAFKLGSTVPVKFKIGCGSAPVKEGAHSLQVIKQNNATTAAEPVDATPADAATSGSQFKLTGDEWHFNLDTKATGMTAGTWQLKATLADGSTHTVWIELK